MSWSDGPHLFSLYDALYRGLGTAAPSTTNDALTVRMYELGRLFGAEALDLRTHGYEAPPSPLVLSMIEHASLEDSTGALALFVVTMLLSPRLLVWLRDLSLTATDEHQVETIRRGQALLVSSMNETGAILARQPALDSPILEGVVAEILQQFVDAGWDEHLGPRS